MSGHELKTLLDDVPDTFEIVLRHETCGPLEREAWLDAGEEARSAFAVWCAQPGRGAYAVYRAAQDRADAAQDALAHTHTSRGRVS